MKVYIMMSEEELSYIVVRGIRVGIISLKTVLEKLSAWKGKKDEEIADLMLVKLKARNYIPPSVEAEYRQAFLREFKKFVGEPVAEEESSALRISILGPGCPSCDKLEELVMAVLADENIPAEVEHVRDPVQIARYGVMGTPALVINGKIRSSGLLPNKNQIAKWLREIAVHR